MKPGLYANIHAKQERIKNGSGEKCVKLAVKVRQVLQTLNKPPRQENKSLLTK